MTLDGYDADEFRQRFGPWALVVGASDGIGECFARRIAERGLNVVLLGRRAAVLGALADDLAREHGVETRTIVVDLTGDDVLGRVDAATAELDVGLLVYNAGADLGTEPFLDRPVEDALRMVALNCRGPVLLAHHFATRMRERGRGGVVLLSSVAAFAGSSFTAAYNATKSFDLILAEGLWHELAPHGVDVMAVVAGATRTPAMLGANPHFEEFPGVMEPDDVARGGLENLGRGPCWVAGDANRAAAASFRTLSRVELINAMSAASAQLNRKTFTPADGVDFSELA